MFSLIASFEYKLNFFFSSYSLLLALILSNKNNNLIFIKILLILNYFILFKLIRSIKNSILNNNDEKYK